MAESPEDLYARIVDKVGKDGRLPMTPAQSWDVFPWEVVSGALLPKVVQPPLEAEAPRAGDPGGEKCGACSGDGADRAIWENDAWTLRSMPRGGLPLILMLETREHLDFTDLDDDQAAEFGRLTLWITRIMSNLANIGRVHVGRYGDGGSHVHIWFIARPERFTGILGSLAIEWDDMLPPTPEEHWLGDRKAVAERLARHDGRALV